MFKISNKIFFGGDYNPDQWDDETIDIDMKYFKELGVNLVTLPVFAWAKLEPSEGIYDFDWLDKLMNKFSENNISVCLATPTVAQPSWLSTKYPEVLPVDISGRKRTHGMRVFFCYNSEKYRERAGAIAEEMAKRYSSHPALAIWHVANEYGTYCYCENCQKLFREWLQNKYKTINNLNEKWNTTFWGRQVYEFDEVTLPTELNDDYRFNPIIQLDYLKFVTDSTVECFNNEYNILKKYTPNIPVQTNISGYIKKLNQFEMAKHMDVIGWDNYPWPTHDKSLVAFKHDIMRGLKDGQPYILAEQSPNQQNWQPYNKLKKPGEVRMLAYQAMAHGADTCLYFQLRQSTGGQEKFHGAMISHSGRNDTRIFKECANLGKELEKIGDAFIGGTIDAKVGILFDWENWWALEQSSGPSVDINYLEFVAKYYKVFYDLNIPVDILHFNRDLSSYELIISPMMYMIKDDIDKKIIDYVKKGGNFIATTMTGLVDDNDKCVFGEYPGPLKELLGIRVEETDALLPDENNGVQYNNKIYKSNMLCDLINLDSAMALGVYEYDFYKGLPAVTKNKYGDGNAYYIGTDVKEDFLIDFINYNFTFSPEYYTGENVEVTKRINENIIYFVLNHNHEKSWIDFGEDKVRNLLTNETLTGRVEILPRDVFILKK
ncbi:MAG: beta-galactosidase [Lachnospirales bacterium]